MAKKKNIIPVLAIGGLDPSGGAGMVLDVEVFHSLGLWPMALCSAITVQSTLGVENVRCLDARFFQRQLEYLIQDIRPRAIKCGMLGNEKIVSSLAQVVRHHELQPLVLDPVMESTTGSPLYPVAGLKIMQRELLPLAHVVVPNIPEAMMLGGERWEKDPLHLAQKIHAFGPRYVIIKGGHTTSKVVEDLLYDGKDFKTFRQRRLPAEKIHGTGCLYASALCGYLALGRPIAEAARLAQSYVHQALRQPMKVGKGIRVVNKFVSPVNLAKRPR